MRRIAMPGFTLEPQLAAHAPEMFALLADRALYEYENDPPVSVEALRVRFGRLESRLSADGTQRWLNWVIRLPDGQLAGFVQATVKGDGTAGIAYILSSAHWGRGLGSRAVAAMIAELAARYGVARVTAVLKRRNQRSLRLLERLGFSPATPSELAAGALDGDELMMSRATSAADA
jgi:RimJ/RimL family protein N-acetyltransferase